MKIHQLLIFTLLTAVVSHAGAYTSIATIDKETKKSWFRSSNYASQKEADNDALEGCRVTARQNGIGDLAKTCKVVTRAAGPGYGAVTCGEDGCTWATGYDTVQEAVDAAYQSCIKSFTKCQNSDITNWEDFKGFPQKALPQKTPVAAADCRPRTTHLQCTSACTNGNCTVKYENGCKMQVQVQPQFSPISNTWEYPTPSC
jgi:hypothetical protein